MIIKNENVIAYLIGDEHVCPDCIEDNEPDNKLLTEDSLPDDTTLICDRCMETILEK